MAALEHREEHLFSMRGPVPKSENPTQIKMILLIKTYGQILIYFLYFLLNGIFLTRDSNGGNQEQTDYFSQSM